MHTNIDTVKTSIERSMLLKPERKQALRILAEELSPEGLSTLQTLLLEEPSRIASAMGSVIGHAVEEGNAGWLKELERYLRAAAKMLNRADEGATDMTESDQLDHFFDNAA